MKRPLFLAALAVLMAATAVQARLIKEMQVTRTGKAVQVQEGGAAVYKLTMEGNKLIVIGDREFFPPATRAALDQAVEKKLTVEIAGHLLIFNDQPPVFALPLGKLEVKGLDLSAKPGSQPLPAAFAPPAEQVTGDVTPFKEGKLKTHAGAPLGQVLEHYPFFAARSWKLLEPGKAEFRGEIDLLSITELDSRYVERLKSKDLRDTFKTLTFVAILTLKPGGVVECPDPAVESVLQDGTRDRMIWKDPPTYYWERIFGNRKLKVDYFLSKAAINPKYGKGMGQASGQQ
jgi:hypothetical protein